MIDDLTDIKKEANPLQKEDLLKNINTPEDLRKLPETSLEQLCENLREKTIESVAITGGHLGAGLGVVELTVALHYVFNTPKDKIIFDVGHQAYPHKILTGRKDKIKTIRHGTGLSGFTKRAESKYDPFGAGHSSTSISAALGMAIARDKKKTNENIIAVIGDGAMSAGLAYEAMNNAGALNSKLIVILNDNEMSIAKPTGALSNYLSKMMTSNSYQNLRNSGKKFLKKMPKPFKSAVKSVDRYVRSLSLETNIFEELGFFYVGPIDGHDINTLVPVLENLKNADDNRPFLLHVITKKGKGFSMEGGCKENYHAVSKFDNQTKTPKKGKSLAPKYTDIFSKYLIEEANLDDKIIAITAAMPSGTGLDKFEQFFPDRFYDVGIAEQHAVTFAAGLACEEFKPFVTIYSTFLQRAYDQVVHDVALQNLPVRFAIDRAGLVGADGPTHAGTFDITYLATLPNFIIMAPSDEYELARAVKTSASIDFAPSAFRYPRGEATGMKIPSKIERYQIGKGKLITKGQKLAILSCGTMMKEALKLKMLIEDNLNFTPSIADAIFVKPLDEDLIIELCKNHEMLITLEEGSIGGFGSHVSKFITDNNLDLNIQFKSFCHPDSYIDHDTQDQQLKKAELDAESIFRKIKQYLI